MLYALRDDDQNDEVLAAYVLCKESQNNENLAAYANALRTSKRIYMYHVCRDALSTYTICAQSCLSLSAFGICPKIIIADMAYALRG